METETPCSLKTFPRWLRCGCLALVAVLAWDCVLWSAIAAIPLSLIGKSYVHNHFPARYTVPLEAPVAEHLCELLELDSSDERCQGNEAYAVEFFADIRQHYNRGTFREQVDEEIGVYRVGCDEWVLDDTDVLGWFQRCHYDFTGDGEYVLTIKYHVSAPSCYDGSFDERCPVPADLEGRVWGYR
jgi:hypothetical protein